RPRVALDRAFDGVSEPRWRELGLRDQFEDPLGGQAFRSQLLLCFPFGSERDDHGRSPGSEYIEDGIVPGLAHRNAAAPQHLRKLRTIPFEDYSLAQSTGELSECLLRQVGSREQTPCETRQTAASPRLERCRQQGGADRASAGRDQYLVYPYGFVPFVASSALTDITRIDQAISDAAAKLASSGMKPGSPWTRT